MELSGIKRAKWLNLNLSGGIQLRNFSSLSLLIRSYFDLTFSTDLFYMIIK